MKKPMGSAEDELNDRLTMIQNWLEENVRVVTHANELSLCDFSYNPKTMAASLLFGWMASC